MAANLFVWCWQAEHNRQIIVELVTKKLTWKLVSRFKDGSMFPGMSANIQESMAVSCKDTCHLTCEVLSTEGMLSYSEFLTGIKVGMLYPQGDFQ